MAESDTLFEGRQFVKTASAVEYLADFVQKRSFRVIAIYGPSAGGKSTFSKMLLQTIGPDKALCICVDDYWQYSRPEMAARNLTGYDWATRDQPRFLKDLAALKAGKDIDKPLFDGHNELPIRDRTEHVEARGIIILEDTLDFKDVADLLIFVYAPDEILFERRMQRDRDKTSFTPEQLADYIRHKSLPSYHERLLPLAAKADFVLDTQQNQLWSAT